MGYDSILNWVTFDNPVNNAFYPFEVYNVPYDIGAKLWELLGGTIAWLINLLIPGNGLSTWLVSDAVVNAFAIILMVVVIFAVGFIVNLTMIWQERKVMGRGMDRRGTKIGPLGYFQCLGDGLKTFMKENVVPKSIDKKIYWWALALIIGTAVLAACMIPLSDRWFIMDYHAGILMVYALFALAPFFILGASWAQNNKYSMMAGFRAAELMISYEIPMLILMTAVILQTGSFNINSIVNAQSEMWFMVPQIIGFFTFFVCAVAESERSPFDLAEAESELVEGWQTEYAGMKWGLIMLGDYFRGYVCCGLIVILYMGGWLLPFGYGGTAVPELVFLAKIFAVFFFFIMARLAIPRVRIDQILNVGWKVLMPLSVINLLLVVVMQTGGLI